jgi:hypothetical protein
MEKKTKLDLIKEGYEAARDNKPEKKYPIEYNTGIPEARLKAERFFEEEFAKINDIARCHEVSQEKETWIACYMAGYNEATPQGIGWVKASERMPKEAGPITWRWLDKEAAYSGFNGTAFIYDKGGAQVDMLYAIEIEWLNETGQSQQPGREVDKKALELIRDVAENWDCDEDGHRYNTGCRKCSASELLYDLTREKEVKP